MKVLLKFKIQLFCFIICFILIVKQIKARWLMSKEVAAIVVLFLCLPWQSNSAFADQEAAKPAKVIKSTPVSQNSKVAYSITIEKDHMKVALKYQLMAEKDQMEYIDTGAIFIEEGKVLPKGVELQKTAIGYSLHFLKKGDS